MLVEFLADLRQRGVTINAENGALRVSGPRGVYTAAVRAKLMQWKQEILRHLEAERQSAAEEYDRAERAWAVEYGCALACAHGYDDETVRWVGWALRQRPARAPFTIGSDTVVVSSGDGCEVRIQRGTKL